MRAVAHARSVFLDFEPDVRDRLPSVRIREWYAEWPPNTSIFVRTRDTCAELFQVTAWLDLQTWSNLLQPSLSRSMQNRRCGWAEDAKIDTLDTKAFLLSAKEPGVAIEHVSSDAALRKCVAQPAAKAVCAVNDDDGERIRRHEWVPLKEEQGVYARSPIRQHRSGELAD